LDDDRIKLQIQSEKQESEYQREMDAYNNEKTALAQQINSLEVIIRDDSKTVRTVNEAKDKLEQLQSRMRKLSKPVRPR
jgi:cell division protein FtsB